MHRNSERTTPKRKPKFPRLELLRRRRRAEERLPQEDWFCTADREGMVQIRIR